MTSSSSTKTGEGARTRPRLIYSSLQVAIFNKFFVCLPRLLQNLKEESFFFHFLKKS